MNGIARRACVEGWMSFAGAPTAEIELSIELFPPKTPAQAETVRAETARLAALEPDLISVTCGAGGEGGRGTELFVHELRARYPFRIVPHMTCIGSARAEVDAQAQRYWDAGIRSVVALRGDLPGMTGPYTPRPDGYAYASDLVAGLRRIGDFEIAVGGYPETHPAAPSAAFDLDNLARKVDAGATRIITQYCFDTDTLLRFRDRVVSRGITAQLVPGIMPVHNFAQIKRFSGMCGASVPAWLEALFHGIEDQPALRDMVAVGVAAEQCRRLIAEGLTHLHIYALNRSALTTALCRLLGRGVEVAPAAAAPATGLAAAAA
jgi:methylenetetrahydrofolate reductase (NADPH)